MTATNYQNHHTANIVGSHSINRGNFSPTRDEGQVTTTGNGGVFGSESIGGLLGGPSAGGAGAPMGGVGKM